MVRAAFEDAGLKIVDVGARPLPKKDPPDLKNLAPFAHLFAFEPNLEAAEELESAGHRSLWREVTVVPKAVSSREGDATLYQTSAPGGSSLLEPDPEVLSRFRFADALSVVSQTKVPTISLDSAAVEYGFEDACFVKLDTQGTELDILRSGRQLLERSVVGVFIESNFHPFYKGQSLFADNDEYLRRNGFFLIELSVSSRRGRGFRREVRSSSLAGWSDGLYLRDPAELASRPESEAAKLLLRYVLIALAHNHFDLVLATLENPFMAPLITAPAGPLFPREVEDLILVTSRRREGLLGTSSSQG